MKTMWGAAAIGCALVWGAWVEWECVPEWVAFAAYFLGCEALYRAERA